MEARGLDGIVATLPYNVFYLSGFNGIAHKADEPRPYAVILSRHAPEQPILVIADYYLATFLNQPTWVEDIRPFRAVMMPLDLPAKRGDIDRFIPPGGARRRLGRERARAAMPSTWARALRGALADLKLDSGRVGFDDMGFGFRLGVEGLQVADGYDPLMFARAVKTPTELGLLRRSTRAQRDGHPRAPWRPGRRAPPGAISTAPTPRAVTDLGGFVRDPGAHGVGPSARRRCRAHAATGLEDDEVSPART